MSKLTREAIEKAGKLIEKKGQNLDAAVRTELESLLTRGEALAQEYARLKDEAKEKRLDIEDNARAALRLVRKAKRAIEATEQTAKAQASKARPKAAPKARGAKVSGKRAPAKGAGAKDKTPEAT
jgi:hypothetical protein